ncbi:cyclophilin-like fold protein [Halomicrobium salinisoli]|uniref:cyclophilin-like fold protein n=1 Tax=Halomicrobium salinisoli TaxID=2878391 RepID=UPI001CEFC54D|nr:cyclophilin-like family protein [Halomicrobium salinisoli]
MADLTVTVDGRELAAEWTGENSEVRDALADALPVAGDATRWGDELYFSVPIDAAAESTRTEVPEGAVAYWPAGDVLCLFWGPTPASVGDEPRAAEDVAVVATVEDVTLLDDLDGGATVRVEER